MNSRARLLALDRAFALEPHTGYADAARPHPARGRPVRRGRSGLRSCRQATEHDVPQREAAREVLATRRAASLGGRKPKQFSSRERAYVLTGTVPDRPEPIPANQLRESFAPLDRVARAVRAARGVAPRGGRRRPALRRATWRRRSPGAWGVDAAMDAGPGSGRQSDRGHRVSITAPTNGPSRSRGWRAGSREPPSPLAQAPGVEHAADVAGRLGRRWTGTW